MTVGIGKRERSRFVCQACGHAGPRWVGKCEGCGEWNTIVEEALTTGPGPGPAGKPGRSRIAFVGLEGEAEPPARAPTGIAELDRVLGGGLVPASAVLVGGDPGIGKSTLLLQAAASLSRAGRRVLYVSGEESVDQVRLRARRLGLADARMELASATNLRDIAATLATEREGDPGGDRQHPDHVAGQPGQRARLGGAGAGLQLRTDPPGQDPGIRGRAGRPRHQGRRDRRAAGAGAHGRCGAVFRRRARPPVPHPARGEEPFRRDRRDRRVRDDRDRIGRGAPTRRRCSWPNGAATLPAARCSPGWRARARC